MSLFHLPSFLWRRPRLCGAALVLAISCVGTARAADPGNTIPADAAIGGQKAGSVLLYPIYTSGATSGNTQNTRINITNVSSTSFVAVHIWLVGAVINLNPNSASLRSAFNGG